MTTQFESILTNVKYVYGIGIDQVFAETCMEKLLSNKKGLEFFYGHDLTEEEQETLINISDVVICFGNWSEDPSCQAQFSKVSKEKKRSYEITNHPPQGWYMKKL